MLHFKTSTYAPSHNILQNVQVNTEKSEELGFAPGPPPPHSVLFRLRICSFPLFESTPYLRTANIFEPPFRGLFAGFSCLGDPPKYGKMLNVPP